MDKIKRDNIIFFIILSVLLICIYVKSNETTPDNQTIIIYSNEAGTAAYTESPNVKITSSSHVKKTVVTTTTVAATVSANLIPTEAVTADEPIYININTADAEELIRLDCIGDILAGRIVDYREMYGDFRNVEEIMYVHGIGEGIFSAIYPHIYVEDPVYDSEIIPAPDEENDLPDESYDEPESNESQLCLEDVAPIDINTADVELLMLLPYVTEDIAIKIIQLREDIGGYSHPYEIYYIGDLEDKQVNEISKYVFAGKENNTK